MRVPPPPPQTKKHVEERFKFLAGGLQNLALLLFGAVLLQPLINASLTPATWLRALAIFISGVAELSAIILLRYIPFQSDPKEKVP